MGINRAELASSLASPVGQIHFIKSKRQIPKKFIKKGKTPNLQNKQNKKQKIPFKDSHSFLLFFCFICYHFLFLHDVTRQRPQNAISTHRRLVHIISVKELAEGNPEIFPSRKLK
jgi:hypothetical protein